MFGGLHTDVKNVVRNLTFINPNVKQLTYGDITASSNPSFAAIYDIDGSLGYGNGSTIFPNIFVNGVNTLNSFVFDPCNLIVYLFIL